MNSTPRPVLEVRGLSVSFRSKLSSVLAVDDVSLQIGPGRILGVVGESGCGKSTLGMSLMGLLPKTAAVTGGQVLLTDRDLLGFSSAQLRAVRGREIGMIFQEPMTSLNPVMRIGRQVAEVVRKHEGLSRRAALARAVELLDRVGIPEPKMRADAYPHQLSGGMRQRVVIAIAIACRPKLIIADEPTTALDLTVQAQVLTLLHELSREHGISVLLITHDLGAIARMADDVMIMYAGRRVEVGATEHVLGHPSHPYTARLLASVPQPRGSNSARERLAEIPGRVPSLSEPAAACSFAARCSHALPICTQRRPELQGIGDTRVACFDPEGR